MKIIGTNSKAKHKSCGLYFIALLALVLALLFWRSFLPNYIHFANDGPLGQQNTDWIKLPSGFNGMWVDLNTIGFNASAFPVSIIGLIKWSLSPVGYAKFLAPIALFILGLGAWTFFKQLKFSPLATFLGAVAVALSSTFFSGACWGVATQEIALGMDFFALALIVSNTRETPILLRCVRLALAGMAVGVNVMEGADIGALCSVFIAGFVFFKALIETEGTTLIRAGRGVLHVAVIAIFAGFIAIQSITALVGSQIQGIAGTSQDAETKAANWDKATQWSMAKTETLSLLVPGLFGYRMDTPANMMPLFQNAYVNGNYWGSMGRSPEVDRLLDSGATPPPGTPMRFSGGGAYCGVLVVLVAIWTIGQSFRRKDSPFTDVQKKFIWFWLATVVISIPIAWGRYAPIFYGALYQLPYFSTIRNPVKFSIFAVMALPVLFAYGVNALSLRYLDGSIKKPFGFKNSFDRKWAMVFASFFGASILSWWIYSSEMPTFIAYLQKVGFTDIESASQIAAFSLAQVGWFVGLMAVAVGLLILTTAGFFSGPRAKLGAFLLGAFLLFDLSRADLPWIIHWDYKQKYEIGTLNPVEDFLRHASYEHRVAQLPFESKQPLRAYDNSFGGPGGLYGIEWAQHHFPYYNIQSLDVIQMPRKPADLAAFDIALAFANPLRKWELTNTRYLLGPAGFLEPLNGQLDPQKRRFRIAQRFDLVSKPGITHLTKLEEITAVTNSDGDLALFDFTGALPRAKLYSNWKVAKTDPDVLQTWVKDIRQQVPAEVGNSLAGQSTNDLATLHTLVDTNFDPAQTVLLSTPEKDFPSVATNENSGSVEFKSYAPKDIVFNAQATTPAILLLNDKYDPHWSVTVDGKPAPLLRCNFIMRGVYLTPGAHTVEFQFHLSNVPLYITLVGIAVAFLLCGYLFLATRPSKQSKT
ncbi:MAG TPA: hypothetical protein VGO57_06415 [Verrucomicrobiae bacterium]|jgi:hypothetical protein